MTRRKFFEKVFEVSIFILTGIALISKGEVLRKFERVQPCGDFPGRLKPGLKIGKIAKWSG